MGLFGFGKKKQPQKTTTTPNTTGNGGAANFYTACVEDFHNEAAKYGAATRGLIFIPELLPVGEKTVLAFLKDPFFQMQFGSNPQMYYYATKTKILCKEVRLWFVASSVIVIRQQRSRMICMNAFCH